MVRLFEPNPGLPRADCGTSCAVMLSPGRLADRPRMCL
jgi:hypothetical protein